MAKDSGRSGKSAPVPAVSGGAKKAPQLNMRLKKDDAEKVIGVRFAVKNAGKAGRIFQLNADGEFQRVVPAGEFASVWGDKSVAHSKRGLSEEKTQYLSAKAEIDPAQKDDVQAAVKSEFPAILKLVQDGMLKSKRAKKTELVVVPLV